MSKAYTVNHKEKNRLWVRPQISYDAWKKFNDYAKTHGTDLPTAVDLAANLLPEN